MITVRNINKSFGKFKALNDMNLNVETGSIYGLVGPNGSGKTTLMKHLAGLMHSYSGEVLYDGQEVYENIDVKKNVVYLPDNIAFRHEDIKDLKDLFKGMYDSFDEEYYRSLIDMFNLTNQKHMNDLSKGMKKQAYLASVLAVHPSYLILDEPMDGLDPIARKQVYKILIDEVISHNMTVVISSHNLKELEDLCDHIGIMNNGHMILECELDAMRSALHKIQMSTLDEEIMKDLDILYREDRGSLSLLIVKNDINTLEAFKDAHKPALFDILPLTLEKIFFYELGGDNDDIQSLIF